MRRAPTKPRQATAGRVPSQDIGISAPPGTRMYRYVVEETEYAVLVLPTVARRRSRAKMTTAEQEVVTLIGDGLSNEAIAARRGTSVRTVANQLQSIYRKLGVRSRLALCVHPDVSRRLH